MLDNSWMTIIINSQGIVNLLLNCDCFIVAYITWYMEVCKITWFCEVHGSCKSNQLEWCENHLQEWKRDGRYEHTCMWFSLGKKVLQAHQWSCNNKIPRWTHKYGACVKKITSLMMKPKANIISSMIGGSICCSLHTIHHQVQLLVNTVAY